MVKTSSRKTLRTKLIMWRNYLLNFFVSQFVWAQTQPSLASNINFKHFIEILKMQHPDVVQHYFITAVFHISICLLSFKLTKWYYHQVYWSSEKKFINIWSKKFLWINFKSEFSLLNISLLNAFDLNQVFDCENMFIVNQDFHQEM